MALGEIDLGAYVAWVRGELIDVDGVFGAQCWDQWSHYATNFLGVPSWPTYTNAGGTYPHQGYACNVLHNAASAGLSEWFEILPADTSPRAGDVAFWEFGSTWYPLSHVATVLEVTHGGRMLRCLTQNPGAVQVADLIVDGVIGYLRPRALIVGVLDTSKSPKPGSSGGKPTIHGMESEMIVFYAHALGKGKPGWLVLGFTPKALILSNQESANGWARRIGRETIPAGYDGFRKYLRSAGGTAVQLSRVSKGV